MLRNGDGYVVPCRYRHWDQQRRRRNREAMVDQVGSVATPGLVLDGAAIYSESDADQVAAKISYVSNRWSRLDAPLMPVLSNRDDKIQMQSVSPRPRPERTSWVDQIGNARILLLKPEQVCNPAHLEQETIASPTDAAGPTSRCARRSAVGPHSRAAPGTAG